MAVIGAVALVGACGLNPQPIPPGETDGQEGRDSGVPSATTGGDADASNKNDDGGTTLNPGNDGGDDASDASEDASDSGDT